MAQSTSQPRTRCRLPCTITRDRKRIHARVLDVSEGGLCIVTPVRFEHRSIIALAIEVPLQGAVEVEAIVWHERPYRQPSSGRRGWATGLMISKAGPEYQALVNPDAHLETRSASAALDALLKTSRKADPVPFEELDAGDGSSIYRVRVRTVGGHRTKVLTLSAASEEAVREAVVTDLPGEWEVVDVEVNPLD